MTIQLYILRHLVLSIGFSISAIALIVLPTLLIQAINKLGAVGILTILSYLPLVLVDLVPYLMPMAFLLGVVGTYGRLAAEREIVAIRMAGIHPAKLALPAFMIALVLTGVTHELLASVAPTAKYRARNYLRQQAVEAFKNFGQGGSSVLEFGKSTLNADSKHGNVFEGVLLELAQEKNEVLTITADVAVLEIRYDDSIDDDVLFIELQNASVLGDNTRLFGESPYCSYPLSELFPFERRLRTAKYIPSAELAEVLAAGGKVPGDPHEILYEIHRRRAISMTYLLFLLLGIPTGIMLRSSTQLGAFTGAVGLAFVYYILAMHVGKALADSGAVSPIVAAWSTNALFLVVGSVFFYRSLWR